MRQVLPVVGAAIGAYFGGAQGAQIGWAIGSIVGNAVDPQVIKGPSIGDLATQTSQEGVPRPIVFALSQPISGNIVMCSNPKIVTKRQRQGKGGPVTETQSVYRSYAIGICEGPNIVLVRVWSNGKLVYDARPGQPDPGNAKFLQNAVFHAGDWDQMPDGNMQAVFGAANVPAMRGTAYVAWHDVDLTSQGGAVPQYVFQVMRCEGQLLTSRPYALELESALAPSADVALVRIEQQPFAWSNITPRADLLDIQVFGGSQSYSYTPPENVTMTADILDIQVFGGAKSYSYTPPENVAAVADILDIQVFGGAVNYAIGDRDVNNVKVSADILDITLG